MENNIKKEYIDRLYKYIKNGMNVEDFLEKFHLSYHELTGILELFRLYGRNVEIIKQGDTIIFDKPITRTTPTKKPDLDFKNLIHTEIGVVSDTHFGNIHQQLHLLNDFYEECYRRGINIVLHCGDLVDGNYLNRPEQPRQQFLHGFDEQVGYVVDMYPEVKGIKTKYILASHDETHYKNGQATVSKWVSLSRRDMEFLGQDCASININGVKIFMDHPGGGSAQSISYKPQKRIEILESNYKPKVLLIGHYHKSYAFVYRNVHGIEVPAFCDKTQFQQKQGLNNVVGAYILNIYSDKLGNIVYFEPEEILYSEKDMWDEGFKDKNKVRKLVIK